MAYFYVKKRTKALCNNELQNFTAKMHKENALQMCTAKHTRKKHCINEVQKRTTHVTKMLHKNAQNAMCNPPCK